MPPRVTIAQSSRARTDRCGLRAGSCLSGLVLSPEKALHQGIISLADQAVASATNFVTGIIIARTCSKEELGLYMLGFSLILLMTDFQTSLITTPYMVYAPRLKGRRPRPVHGKHPDSSVGILSHHDARCCVRSICGQPRNRPAGVWDRSCGHWSL